MATTEHNACPSCGGSRWKQSVKGVVFTCRGCGHHRGRLGEQLTEQEVKTYRAAMRETIKTVDSSYDRGTIAYIAGGQVIRS